MERRGARAVGVLGDRCSRPGQGTRLARCGWRAGGHARRPRLPVAAGFGWGASSHPRPAPRTAPSSRGLLAGACAGPADLDRRSSAAPSPARRLSPADPGQDCREGARRRGHLPLEPSSSSLANERPQGTRGRKRGGRWAPRGGSRGGAWGPHHHPPAAEASPAGRPRRCAGSPGPRPSPGLRRGPRRAEEGAAASGSSTELPSRTKQIRGSRQLGVFQLKLPPAAGRPLPIPRPPPPRGPVASSSPAHPARPPEIPRLFLLPSRQVTSRKQLAYPDGQLSPGQPRSFLSAKAWRVGGASQGLQKGDSPRIPIWSGTGRRLASDRRKAGVLDPAPHGRAPRKRLSTFWGSAGKASWTGCCLSELDFGDEVGLFQAGKGLAFQGQGQGQSVSCTPPYSQRPIGSWCVESCGHPSRVNG